MFEFLFIDLDDTILDFHKAEAVALSKTLTEFGLAPTPEICGLYSRINKDHWERLERKEIARDQVRVGRFDVLFGQLGHVVDAGTVARCYEKNLATGHYFLPGAQEALESLWGKYRLFLTSNGNAHVQHGRLTSADLYRFFEKVFVSQEIGFNKPDREFFDRCFAQIPGFDRGKAMIVGDSLTSDILGGQNAGIATCWVNAAGKTGREDIRADYQISSLSELEDLLERIG